MSDKKVIVIEVPRFGVEAPPLEQRVRVVTRAEPGTKRPKLVGQQEQVRELLAQDAEANARFLREHRESRDVRVQAARLLALLSKRLGP